MTMPRVLAGVLFVVHALVTLHRLAAPGMWRDEYYFLLARAGIVEQGVPVLPSGLVYVYGGPALWWGALGTAVDPLSVFWNRVPFALPCLLLPVVVHRIASRRIGERGAVAAVAVVVLHAGVMIWSTHVGHYGLQTLVFTLAVGAWLRWALDGERRAAWWFAGATVLALSMHVGVALFLPGLWLLAASVRGRTWWKDRTQWLVAVVCAGATAAAATTIAVTDPTLGSRLLAGSAADADLSWQLGARVLRVLRGMLSQLVWNWHGVAAGIASLTLLVSLRGRLGEHAPLARLAAVWWLGVALLYGLSTYTGHRYLLAGVVLLALPVGVAFERLWSGDRGRLARMGAVAVGLGLHAWIGWPGFGAALDRGTDQRRALEALGSAVETNDLVLAGGTPVALHTRSRSDRAAIVLAAPGLNLDEQGSDPRDRFTGDPALTSFAQVRDAFESRPRVWYVAWEADLSVERIPPEVHAWLVERCDRIDVSDTVSVYRKRE